MPDGLDQPNLAMPFNAVINDCAHITAPSRPAYHHQQPAVLDVGCQQQGHRVALHP